MVDFVGVLLQLLALGDAFLLIKFLSPVSPYSHPPSGIYICVVYAVVCVSERVCVFV